MGFDGSGTKSLTFTMLEVLLPMVVSGASVPGFGASTFIKSEGFEFKVYGSG